MAIEGFDFETYAALKAYVDEHGGGGGDAQKPFLATLTIGTSWSGNDPYTQPLTVSGYTVTSKTKVDLVGDETVIASLVADGVSQIHVVNTNSSLSVVALGAAPTAQLTVQAVFTEVNV